MDQVPILVAETLRDIADNRLGRQTEQHLLRQVERMLHNAGDETDVIVDEFQHQLQQLVAQNNDLNLQVSQIDDYHPHCNLRTNFLKV